MKYLRHSDFALRVSLNPFNWNWIPRLAHDKPTKVFPKRHTYCFAFLFLQLFVDVDNGEMDLQMFNPIMLSDIEINDDEYEMGSKVP